MREESADIARPRRLLRGKGRQLGWLNVMHNVQNAKVVPILLVRVRHWRICVGVTLAGEVR